MHASDRELLAALADSPWERMQREAVPDPLDDEISGAFEFIMMETTHPIEQPTSCVDTIRVATDLTWALASEDE